MKRKQFSEEQIIGILKEAEAGANALAIPTDHSMGAGQQLKHKIHHAQRRLRFNCLKLSETVYSFV